MGPEVEELTSLIYDEYMQNFSKEDVKELMSGAVALLFEVVRTGKDAVGEVVGQAESLKAARDIQKASKAKTMIVKITAKMVK